MPLSPFLVLYAQQIELTIKTADENVVLLFFIITLSIGAKLKVGF